MKAEYAPYFPLSLKCLLGMFFFTIKAIYSQMFYLAAVKTYDSTLGTMTLKCIRVNGNIIHHRMLSRVILIFKYSFEGNVLIRGLLVHCYQSKSDRILMFVKVFVSMNLNWDICLHFTTLHIYYILLYWSNQRIVEQVWVWASPGISTEVSSSKASSTAPHKLAVS